MKHLATVNPLHWIIMGYFNDIRSQEDKRERNPHPNWHCRGFNQAIKESGLQDLVFE